MSSASHPREESVSAGYSCPSGKSSPSQKWGLWHCQESSRDLGLLLTEETPCSASAGWKGWAANTCQLTQCHQIHSSRTVLVAAFLTTVTAQILNPFEERSGAFHHRKTNTFLVLSAAKLQNMTLGCSTNNRGKAFLFSLEIPSLLHAV